MRPIVDSTGQQFGAHTESVSSQWFTFTVTGSDNTTCSNRVTVLVTP